MTHLIFDMDAGSLLDIIEFIIWLNIFFFLFFSLFNYNLWFLMIIGLIFLCSDRNFVLVIYLSLGMIHLESSVGALPGIPCLDKIITSDSFTSTPF